MAAIAEQTVEDFKAFVNSDTFEDFRMLYYAAKGEFPKTVGDVLDAISDKTITPRDLFDESFNSKGFTEEQEDYWLSNLDLFDYDCYYPPVEKQLQADSCWIKVKTETGFQLHLARKATRKFNFNQLATSATIAYTKELSKMDISDEGSAKVSKKQLDATFKQVRAVIGLQPYELWYWRTKTQKAYVTPNEYEIIDIQEWVDYVQDKHLKGVLTVRSLFTAKNQDKIFYLQSRGISLEVAKIFANLDQCYFDFNMVLGMDIVNEEMKQAFSSQLSL